MNIYFLNNINMGKLATTLATGALALSLSANADTVKNNPDQQKVEKKVQQKLDTVVCKTKTACDLLSQSIQTQIDGLETKGLENLTDEEFERYANLSDKLIAVERAETAHNSNLIADKEEEVKAEKIETKASYAEVNANMNYIKGSLLSK